MSPKLACVLAIALAVTLAPVRANAVTMKFYDDVDDWPTVEITSGGTLGWDVIRSLDEKLTVSGYTSYPTSFYAKVYMLNPVGGNDAANTLSDYVTVDVYPKRGAGRTTHPGL